VSEVLTKASKAGAAELKRYAESLQVKLEVTEETLASTIADISQLVSEGEGLDGHALAMDASLRVLKNTMINATDRNIKKAEVEAVVASLRGSVAVLAALG